MLNDLSQILFQFVSMLNLILPVVVVIIFLLLVRRGVQALEGIYGLLQKKINKD